MYDKIYQAKEDQIYLGKDIQNFHLQVPENEFKSHKSSGLTSQSQQIKFVTNTTNTKQYHQITSNADLASENLLNDLQIVQEENIKLISQLQILQLNTKQYQKEIQDFDEKSKYLESKHKEQILRIQLENDINYKKVEQENVKLLSQVEVYQKKQQQYEILINDYLVQIDKLNAINNSLQQQLILVQKDSSIYYKDQDKQIQKISEMNQQLLTQITQLNNQRSTDSLQIKDLSIIRQTLQDQVKKHQDEINLLNQRLKELSDQNSQLSQMNTEYLNQITVFQTQVTEVQNKLQQNKYERETKIRQNEQQTRQSSSFNSRHIEELNSKILNLNNQLNLANQQKQQLQQELYITKKQLQQEQEDKLSVQSRQSKQNQQSNQILELEERIRQLQQQIDNEQLNKSMNNGDLDIKNKQILMLEQKNQKLQQQLEQFHVQMEEEKSLLYKEIDQLSDQNKRAKQLKVTEYDLEYRNSVKQKETLQQELSKANQIIQKFQSKIKALEDQIMQLSKEYESSKQENKFLADLEEQLKQCQRKYELEIKDYNIQNQQLNSQLDKVQSEFQQMKQKYIREIEDLESRLQKENQRVSLQLNDKVSDLSQLELKNKQLQEELKNIEQRYEKKLREANNRIQDMSDDLEIMIENYKKEKQLNEKWESQNEDLRRQLSVQVEEIQVKTERMNIEKYERQSIETKKQIEQVQQKLNNEINQIQGEVKQKNEQINQLKQLNQQQEQKISKFESYIHDLEDQLQQYSRKEELLNQSKNQSLADSLNVKIIQLENNLIKAQKKEDQFIQRIRQLEQQQNSFRNTSVQRELEQKNNQMFEEIQILVQTIKSQDFEIQTLKNELIQYQKEVSFMKEVVNEDTNRLETSLLDDKNRKIIELENKCALLANENTRLNQLKTKQADEFQKKYDKLKLEMERSLNFKEQNEQDKNIIISSNFGQISNAK
ncbi:unnamed protein product [Paramecium primaurelia]|uniref:SPX domain-containing protein n=1 Tax=Paramecium primaurelia TaxID=5886 RepID=A0A8S1M8R6_PARPR|nr:unnamed protein product [Paramecium primaurelia]